MGGDAHGDVYEPRMMAAQLQYITSHEAGAMQ